MGFQFRLEALKRYRHFQEEMCQKEYSDAQRRHDSERQALMELIAERNKTASQMQADGEQSTTGPHLMTYAHYLQHLGKRIGDQRRVIAEAQNACEEKREGLILAMQKRKILETLKTHSLKRYLQNLNREEEKFINEMAINRHILNRE